MNVNKSATTLLSDLREHYKSVFDKEPEDVTLPEWAWPGGYTVVYFTKEGDALCYLCATDVVDNGDDGRLELTWDTYDEGPTLYCDQCNKAMESSYGEAEAQ